MEYADTPKTTAKDFFLNLSAIAGLYVSAASLINLLFETANSAFPDNLDFYRDPYSGNIRFAIASLVIVFPLFIFLSSILEREYVRLPAKRDLTVRKWLVYLTLFLAGVAIAVDLVVLINVFLGGETTTRFISKIAVVLLIAGLIFGYYTSDLREKLTPSKRRIWAIFVSLLVLVSMAAGFMIMGSPAQARKLRFDEQRVQDLQSIQWQIVEFWQRKDRLPQTLEELNNNISGFMVPQDPETSIAYTYEVVSQTKEKTVFNLCAIFLLQSGSDRIDHTRPVAAPAPAIAVENSVWTHSAGDYCFSRTIDPELYPFYPVKGQ